MSLNTKKTPEESQLEQEVGEVIDSTVHDDDNFRGSTISPANTAGPLLQQSGKPPKDWRSWRQWLKWLEASDSQGLTTSQMFLYNEDLKPVEEKRRLWRWWNFVNFWVADSVNVNSFQIAATGVEAGLTWWECWIAIWVGYFFSAMFVVWSARVGSHAHISFRLLVAPALEYMAPYGL